MQKLILLFLLFIVVGSCGSDETDIVQEEIIDLPIEPTADEDAAVVLRDKFGAIYTSYFELAQRPIEESVCSGSSSIKVPEVGHVLNVFVATNFLMANFDPANEGIYDYKMPIASIANGTPVREFSWLNFTGKDSTYFDLYRQYEDLSNLPDEAENEVQKMAELNTKLASSLFGIIAIVDFEPPRQIEISKVEGGYIMGYVMFADWKTATVECMTPFLAANGDVSGFNGSVDMTLEDLEKKAYMQLDSIARVATGYDGEIVVNP